MVFEGKKLHASVYTRDSLLPGRKLSGPAIVAEYSATTVIPAGKAFWLDRHGNLVIEIKRHKPVATR